MMTLYDDVVFYYGCFSESEFFIDKYVKMYYKKILKQIFEIGIFLQDGKDDVCFLQIQNFK